VVYDPAKDEMFWAEKGQGAWLNDRRGCGFGAR
jgi:myo-inositol-1(or 4)-monophosphatase